MGDGRALIAASILNADLANLAREVRRAVKAGADRIHLDVMDARFVPNLTFGWSTIAHLRPVTRSPFDAHLMIAEPGRWLDDFLAAGCDSITVHVEVEEPIEPILRRIKAAGRAAGLAMRPGTPMAALEPYRHLLDIVMVMTVEPGFGGQVFLREVAESKIPAARRLLADKPWAPTISAVWGRTCSSRGPPSSRGAATRRGRFASCEPLPTRGSPWSLTTASLPSPATRWRGSRACRAPARISCATRSRPPASPS